MNRVALMKRTDTKFIVSQKDLDTILPEIKDAYHILEIEGKRLMRYESLYYDTADLSFYKMHHNGIARRVKVRTRKYVDSNLSFLEIKQKNAKGQTVKKRMEIADYATLEPQLLEAYTFDVLDRKYPLKSILVNSFNRFTLVHKKKKERVTIDTTITFQGKSLADGLVIVELKQEKLDRSSELFTTLKERGIHPTGFSKYCMGLAYHKPELKQNLFKPKFNKLKKILTA